MERKPLFTKFQLFGILILVSLLALTIIGLHYLKAFNSPQIDSTENLENAEPKADQSNYYPYSKSDLPAIHHQAFDPNNADSITLLEQGLTPFVASNILRYRRAGGTFKTKSSLQKIYGMNDTVYFALKKDIQLPDSIEKPHFDKDTTNRPTFIPYQSGKKDTILELNTCDTTELQMIRGIGPYFAKKIVNYRQALGGYYSIEQLNEIENFNPDSTLLAHFTIDTTLVTKIPVNQYGVKNLRRHPYIHSTEKAVTIYEYRRKHIHISSLDEIRSLSILTEEELNRLKPYLDFKYEEQ